MWTKSSDATAIFAEDRLTQAVVSAHAAKQPSVRACQSRPAGAQLAGQRIR
jgi:hypothetical protein